MCPWSVGGGKFEFGFSSRSGLFSGPGSLKELSLSAFSVSALSCPEDREANAALARVADPTPKKVRLDRASTADLLPCCSLAQSSPSIADLNPFASGIGIPLSSFIVPLSYLACDGTGMLLGQLFCQPEHLLTRS